MVSLVFVSHSRALAESVVALVRQVVPANVAMAIAAGVGEDRQEFGTDAMEVCEAIQSVYSPDGVLILMDLGSAVLSAEMALELLPDEMRPAVRFCAAPLVEGAIAAGVQAGLGSDLETVYQEAQQALLPKMEQLGVLPAVAPGAAPAEEKGMEGAKEVTLTLVNLHGLHARPAARFVQTAASYQADIQVVNLTTGKGPVSAKSLNALATLGAVEKHRITIRAVGNEAEAALRALGQLVEDGFGELAAGVEAAPAVAAPQMAAEGALQAVPVSEGIALGPFYAYSAPPPPIPEGKVEDSAAEWSRLEKAIQNTQKEIRQRKQQLTATLGVEQTAIFEAHLLILQDPDLLGQVHNTIFNQQENAAAAWNRVIKEVAASYRALDDPYLQQRAADVMDVGNQVLFALIGKSGALQVQLAEPVILFAEDITPTETAQLDMEKVLGLVTVAGGPTSHSAILARAQGIPAISGVKAALGKTAPGTLLGLDGFSGRLWIDPPDEVQAELKEHRAAWLAQRKKLLQGSSELAVTRDGRRVEVAANVGSAVDAQAAVKNGAEGVGLLRTEFLYLNRDTPPSEAEQTESLAQIAQVMGDRPIVIRTLDVGGDKVLPYIHLAPEANPFLGVRAIRMCQENPELFASQLRAILRAGAGRRFRIMFPMIANLEEVRWAKGMLAQAHQELDEKKIDHCWPIETGIMIEIPAAAILSRVIAPEVDFFSIGTNDLTQYTLAAERGNPSLSGLADAMHPAVLKLIGEVVENAHHFGKWVGVCGELAGDPLAAPVLTGLGVDELSMNAAAIPRVKAVLRQLSYTEASQQAPRVAETNSASAARQLARDLFGER